ncbi:MAG TPA: trypsin-like peptidase domain-containing protein [Thermomicrobiales bacterium]|nr:trypsin-like peptidase domain-containing protein [Thermomicrobiales bacterium]
MLRLAIGVIVVAALALAVLAPNGSAQNLLPTPKGQLGGAPAAPSAAIPVTPPVPPLATIPIVLAPAPTSPLPAAVATAPAVNRSATPRPGAVPAAPIARSARSIATIAIASSATGSGTIVADGRHVVTALDVIGSATTAEVIGADGVRAKATVVGADPESGLAVLEIDANLGQALAFAPAPLAVGDPVGAIGGGGGAGQAMSSGIVTATDAWFPAGPPATWLVAIDAPAGAAADGGALVDADGALAGVLIDDRLAGANATTAQPDAVGSVRYAVPAAIVRRVVDDLIRMGHVNYPWLGVAAAAAPGAREGPAQVVAVIPGSPAAQAGIEAGDVLVALDGRPFGPGAPASVALLAHAPGDRVRIELRRDGVDQTLTVSLGAKPPP